MRLFFVLAAVVLLANHGVSVKYTLRNRCKQTLYIGILGSCLPNGRCFESLNNGGLRLTAGQKAVVNSPQAWNGRFWARTGCDNNGRNCKTGDCGRGVQCAGAGGQPDVTLAEITQKGTPDSAGALASQDYYDVSHVDAANLPLTMKPMGGHHRDGTGDYRCTMAGCRKYLATSSCPAELQEKKNGQIVSCLSACTKFHNDQYCCRGAYGTPDKCQASRYARYFSRNCPKAYAYAYDDRAATFTCNAQHYVLTWC